MGFVHSLFLKQILNFWVILTRSVNCVRGDFLLGLMLTSAGHMIIYWCSRNKNLFKKVQNIYFPQLLDRQCPCLFVLLQNYYCKQWKSVLVWLCSADIFCSEWCPFSFHLLIITFLFQFVTAFLYLYFLNPLQLPIKPTVRSWKSYFHSRKHSAQTCCKIRTDALFFEIHGYEIWW